MLSLKLRLPESGNTSGIKNEPRLVLIIENHPIPVEALSFTPSDLVLLSRFDYRDSLQFQACGVAICSQNEESLEIRLSTVAMHQLIAAGHIPETYRDETLTLNRDAAEDLIRLFRGHPEVSRQVELKVNATISEMRHANDGFVAEGDDDVEPEERGGRRPMKSSRSRLRD